MRGISQSAAKHVYKQMAARYKAGEEDLWLGDMWTHLGYCITICLENPKLVQAFSKGQAKIMETLIGKTVKAANTPAT